MNLNKPKLINELVSKGKDAGPVVIHKLDPPGLARTCIISMLFPMVQNK